MKRRAKSKVFARLVPYGFFWLRSGSLLFLLIATFLLAVSFVRPSVFSGARVGAVDLLAPLLTAVSQPFVNVAEFVGNVSGVAELRAENTRLEAENMRLKEWYQTALILQAENQSLQALLNLKIEAHHSFVSARVISDSGRAYVKSVLIAAGSSKGVEKGEAVLSGDGLLGRVIEAGKKASRVLLLSDFNSRVPVLIEGTQQKAILTGTNRRFPTLTHLPPDMQVSEGTRIVTSGHGGLFPPGLPVGEVSIGEDGLTYVRPFADMDRITYVRVLDVPLDPNLRRGRLHAQE